MECNSSQSKDQQKQVTAGPQIQRESAGPQLAGFGSKKDKDKQQQPQSQSLSQQLESNLGNLGDLSTKQNDSINESLDQSEQEMNQFFQALSNIKPIKIVKSKEDLTENSEQEEILEDELNQRVILLANHGYELLISKENLTEAIVELRRAENIISTYLFSEGSLPQSLVLFTLTNLAIAYYRIGFLEESLVCLENCLVSLKNQSQLTTLPTSPQQQDKPRSQFSSQQEYFSQLANRLKSKRLRCKLHMQCCIILSEMRKHEDALIHSRLAGRLAFKIIIDTMILAVSAFVCMVQDKTQNLELGNNNEEEIEEINNNNNNNNENYLASKNDLEINSQEQQPQQQNTIAENFESFIQIWCKLEISELQSIFECFNSTEQRTALRQLVPLLLELNTRISGSANHYDMAISPYKGELILSNLCQNLNSQNIEFQFEKPDVNVIFKDPETDSPLFNSSILVLLQLQPLAIEDFTKIISLEDELSAQFILKKISYFAITLYCSSTETRFLEDQHMLSYLSPYSLLDSLKKNKYYFIIFKQRNLARQELRNSIYISETRNGFCQLDYIDLLAISWAKLIAYCSFFSFIKFIFFGFKPEDQELNEKYLVLKPLNGRIKKCKN